MNKLTFFLVLVVTSLALLAAGCQQGPAQTPRDPYGYPPYREPYGYPRYPY